MAACHRKHVEYAEQGQPDACEDLEWDPEDPDTIIMTQRGYGHKNLRSAAEDLSQAPLGKRQRRAAAQKHA